MRRDIIIGILASVLVHAGLGVSGNISFDWLKTKKVVQKQDEQVIKLEMPEMIPEPPEPTETDQASTETATIAPPSVADVPGVVNIDSFVQPVQPPPPPKAGITMSIPKNQGPVASGTMGTIFDLKNLDQQPVPRNRTQPVYPFEMKRQGISAEVLVEFICDSDGNVREPRVVKSDNHAFDNAAIDAILKWKFRPGKKGGRAVSARMQQPFSFAITED